MNNQKGRIKFLRQDGHKKKRLDKKWRKPKGIHSKMRHSNKGYRRMPRIGYGSKREEKGLNKKSKLKQVLVNSLSDIKNIDPKKDGIILSTKIGTQKKIIILKEAIKKGIMVFNIKDPNAFIETKEKEFKKRKEEKQEIAKKKEEKRKELETKKKTIEEKIEKSEEEKREEEKREKDKILTQRSV